MRFIIMFVFCACVFGREFEFVRAKQFDNLNGIRSYAYVVTDKNFSTSNIAKGLNFEPNLIIVAKMRVLNGKRRYYLQGYLDDKKYIEIPLSRFGVDKILTEFELLSF